MLRRTYPDGAGGGSTSAANIAPPVGYTNQLGKATRSHHYLDGRSWAVTNANFEVTCLA